MPAVPGAMVGLVRMGAEEAGATVMFRVEEPVPKAFLAASDTTEVPAVVGVPVMAPLTEFTVRPGGSTLAKYSTKGPFVAVIW